MLSERDSASFVIGLGVGLFAMAAGAPFLAEALGLRALSIFLGVGAMVYGAVQMRLKPASLIVEGTA